MLSPGATGRRILLSAAVPAGSDKPTDPPSAGAVVPTISIKLVQSLRLPPGQCAVVPGQVEGARDGAPLLLEPTPAFKREIGLELADTLLQSSADGLAQAVVANTSELLDNEQAACLEEFLAGL